MLSADRSVVQEFRTFLYGLLPQRAGYLKPAIDDMITSWPTLEALEQAWPLGYRAATLQGKGMDPAEFIRVRRQLIRRARNRARRGPHPFVPNPGWPAIKRLDRFGLVRV